jgi:hypothetical protein
MKLNSPFFDKIRVKPENDRRRRTADQTPCDKPGCEKAATNRAPKGQGRENQYWNFCLEHAREFNHSYNFFKDMSVDEVAKYQKDALTGHRPTWKMGERTAGARGTASSARPRFRKPQDASDPFSMFGEGVEEAQSGQRKTVHNAARKAFDQLGLEETAGKAQIKAKFKELVKRHHPDMNGGDRSLEDRLREIIDAYNYLKSAGYC